MRSAVVTQRPEISKAYHGSECMLSVSAKDRLGEAKRRFRQVLCPRPAMEKTRGTDRRARQGRMHGRRTGKLVRSVEGGVDEIRGLFLPKTMDGKVGGD